MRFDVEPVVLPVLVGLTRIPRADRSAGVSTTVAAARRRPAKITVMRPTAATMMPAHG